jgi:3-oxoacyl-(acyl-carrier-protein) synthase
LAAAGAIEAVISILALHHNVAPANVGFEEFDPALSVTPIKETTAKPLRVAMSNSVGFSGNNCVLLFERRN